MAHIDYYFSTISPFTYLAGTRMEEVAARHGATITYRPFDVIAAFARTGGVAPKERHPARLELRAQELRRQAAKHGLAIDLDPPLRAVNAAPSSYAFIAAEKAGGGDLGRLVHAFTGAVWRDKRDIAEDDVIADCLDEAGFDRGLAGMAMLQGAEQYTRNLEDAVNAGVFGAPFYIVDGTEKFWGQDRIEDLDLFLSGKL
ncbi:2-hydroxychromene-2-carboxylate isomerase [Maritalea mobilis]|uniref:2-hydroxychromene-2-carboxylate isomerase n=1 Tax=[Roseibacterium] beibuensis TaxID=1193142 RepID=A0ABP9KTC9_9RHOB|nr:MULTISPECIES: 2-hydroxychromene-2-carboxylate isomerase [Alphaproteobacteria]MBY6201201.1 2-hydroxychromene-2-carboxylate isomerase [Maritalea mobilis]MCS6622229.1 2-hydroxychromene-2-carboxylate isomerase [Roseibacterium beibuensis]